MYTVVCLQFLWLAEWNINVQKVLMWCGLISSEDYFPRSWTRKWTAPRFSSQRMAAGDQWDLIVMNTSYQTVLQPGPLTMLLQPLSQTPLVCFSRLFSLGDFNISCCCVYLTLQCFKAVHLTTGRHPAYKRPAPVTLKSLLKVTVVIQKSQVVATVLLWLVTIVLTAHWTDLY